MSMPQPIDDAAGVEMVSPLIARTTLTLPANINDCAISADGTTAACALGDGRVVCVSLAAAASATAADTAPLDDVPAHGVAAVAVERFEDGFVSAGQDGTVVVTRSGGGKPARLWQSGGDWIEKLAISEAASAIGIASGRTVAVVGSDGNVRCEAGLDHTVTGLVFDAAEQRIAASHYGGVSIIAVDSGTVEQRLEWKGAHIGVSWSPDDRYIVTATQEKELHGWDLVTLQDFRMGGYPRKTRQMAWTADGQILACSGADVVTAWSFAGSGPGGRPPIEIGFVFGATVTAVAAHPGLSIVAAGYSSGNVLVGATGKGEALVAQSRTGAAITSLAWSPGGRYLIAGDRRGGLSVLQVPSELPVR